MLRPHAATRPSARECIFHPFFWNDEKKLQFLLDASDRAEDEPRDSPLRFRLEYAAETVVGSNWCEALCPEMAGNLNLNLRRKYDAGSVRDCLRYIRNKKHHYHELPVSAQRYFSRTYTYVTFI